MILRRRNLQPKINRDTVYARHLEVIPRPGEDIERTIRRFTRKVRNDGILQEVYRRSYFEKPSEKRRRKSAAARYLSKKISEKSDQE
jgi:small subunit ribosomal protein S21